MEKMSMIYEALLSLHAEMILDESLRQYHVKRLYDQIDSALQAGDQASFLELTKQLKQLQSVPDKQNNGSKNQFHAP